MVTRSFAAACPLFASFGAELRSQQGNDWSGPFELPGAVGLMYRELGPVHTTVPAYGNDVFFPALAELWSFQAGYRWHGLTAEDLPDWPDQLLVVANSGGDPIAVDRANNTVLFALHGTGDWQFEHLSNSLLDVVLGLGLLGSIVHEAGPNLCDDDSLVLPKYVDHALRSLNDLVGASTAARLIQWAGWTS